MGGENSKDLPDLNQTIDNSFVSQASGASKGSAKSGKSGANKKAKEGSGKKGTTFLGLKTNTTQFIDTSISQYDDKVLDALLSSFLDELQTDREKAKNGNKVTIAPKFNDECSDGYQFLINVMICPEDSERDPDRLDKMKIIALKIIYELCLATQPMFVLK